MFDLISLPALAERLKAAKHSVRVLGTIPIASQWQAIIEPWLHTRAREGDFTVTILCESDNMLFSKAFTSDTAQSPRRQSFERLRFLRDRIFEELLEASLNRQRESESQIPDWLSAKIMHLPIPLAVVEVDSELFVNLWLHEPEDHYAKVTRDHPWHQYIRAYVDIYFDHQHGARYAAERTAEVLELFDHNRIPRGIYPRSSFYDTDYSQLVVWALIFDRRGRLLIHRRESNAADNQSMWDKSVGGHVDFSQDTDTSRAVLREAIEELFSDENKEGAADLAAWSVSDEEVLFLGEWRQERRRRLPFREIAALEREWVFFRLKNSQRLYSPRQLPTGGEKRLRVIADVFVFVAGRAFGDTSLEGLKNSQFKLIELADLKSAMEKAQQNQPVAGFDSELEVPRFTPDLINIMTGELRGTLEQFSQYIKSYLAST